jgi:hypothetical protein
MMGGWNWWEWQALEAKGGRCRSKKQEAKKKPDEAKSRGRTVREPLDE